MVNIWSNQNGNQSLQSHHDLFIIEKRARRPDYPQNHFFAFARRKKLFPFSAGRQSAKTKITRFRAHLDDVQKKSSTGPWSIFENGRRRAHAHKTQLSVAFSKMRRRRRFLWFSVLFFIFFFGEKSQGANGGERFEASHKITANNNNKKR